MVAGSYESSRAVQDMTYSGIVAAEEGLELVGMSLFVLGGLAMLQNSGAVSLSLCADAGRLSSRRARDEGPPEEHDDEGGEVEAPNPPTAFLSQAGSHQQHAEAHDGHEEVGREAEREERGRP